MASVSAIRDGLSTALGAISGLRAYDTVPGQVSPPAAIVEPASPLIVFDSTMGRGSDELAFNVTVLVQYGTDRTSQDALDAYLAGSGASSVKAAIEADDTLGGIVSYARVASATDYGPMTFAGVDYLGVRFSVEVLT